MSGLATLGLVIAASLTSNGSDCDTVEAALGITAAVTRALSLFTLIKSRSQSVQLAPTVTPKACGALCAATGEATGLEIGTLVDSPTMTLSEPSTSWPGPPQWRVWSPMRCALLPLMKTVALLWVATQVFAPQHAA